MSGSNLVQTVPEQCCPHTARGTEAATLMREKVREIDDDVQQVAPRIEHHERTAGRQVLETQFAIEFSRTDQGTGGPAYLYCLNLTGSAIIQHLLHGNTERIFINTRHQTVTTDTQQLAARRFCRT